MILTFKQTHEKYFKGIIGIGKLRELVRTKQIPTLNIQSKKTYFNSDTVEKWLEEGTQQEPQEPQQNEYGKLRQLKP
jgi:hypothetical protein